MLRRILFILTVPAMVLAPVLSATAAQAQSPHFVGTPTCTKSVSTGLTCSGKAAGLGNGSNCQDLWIKIFCVSRRLLITTGDGSWFRHRLVPAPSLAAGPTRPPGG
jgi:hypothetical protein